MEAILTAPIATISVLMVIVLATLWQVWKDHKAVKYKVKSFEERLKEFSSS
jgi:membrane protein YdbS with pleckstrin-like domain